MADGNLGKLLLQLQVAKKADRRLDISIAKAVGYRLNEEPSSRDDKWLTPEGGHVPVLPVFTSSPDAAMRLLLQSIEPESVGGLVINADGTARTKAGRSPTFEAATPALAICTAAVWCLLNPGKATDIN